MIHGFRRFWMPLTESDGDSGSGIRQVLFLGCAGWATWRLVLSRRLGEVVHLRFDWILLCLGLSITALYSDHRSLTIKRSVVVWCGFLLLMGAVHLRACPAQTMMLVVTWTMGGIALVSLGMMLVLPMDRWSLGTRPGLAGLAGHPNTIGPAYAIALTLSLGVVRTGNRMWPMRIIQLALAAALVASLSMTSILTAIVGIAFYYYLERPAYTRGIAQIGVFGTALGVVAIGPATIFESGLSSVGRDTSLSGRDVLWGTVWREFCESPAFGSGYGAFWYEGRGREIMGTWNPRQSHNAYLDLLMDLGLVGAVVVTLFFLGILLRSWRLVSGLKRGSLRATYAALIAMPLSLLSVGAFSESFLFKMDKFQFFTMAWSLLLLSNRGRNRIETEFVR